MVVSIANNSIKYYTQLKIKQFNFKQFTLVWAICLHSLNVKQSYLTYK